MNDFQACHILIDLLGQVLNANKKVKQISAREKQAENLVNKFTDHAFFALLIAVGNNTLSLPSMKLRLGGGASIDVLTRATMEAFLTFYYVFSSPVTEDEKKFKYLSYKLAGLQDRRKLNLTSPKAKIVLAREKEQIDIIEAELDTNQTFHSLTPKNQRQIIRGTWKLQSWKDIALSSNLGETIACKAYSHLCGNAHSSSLSILQLSQAFQKGEQNKLIKPSIGLINILAANMIVEYCKVFPNLQTVVDSIPSAKYVTNIYVGVGQSI